MNRQKKNPNQSASETEKFQEKEGEQRIELRSGEVQELMTRPSGAILKSGITVILVLVLAFFASSLFISYPEEMNTTAKLFPSLDIEHLDAPSDGHLIWVVDSMSIDVKKGDTLAQVVHHTVDTICIVCHVDGHAFKADALERNIDIKAGQHLFYVSKDNTDGKKREVHGVIYLPRDSCSVLRLGQTTEVNFNGFSCPFVITEFGRIANEEGRYPIGITYVDSLNLFNNVEPERSFVTIKMSNQTVFEKFFAKQLNFLNRYKIN